MNYPIHALDSFFYTSMGVYKFQSQCEMVAELGYDGITVSAWGGTPITDLSLLPSVKANHGIDVTALYTVLHEGRNDAIIRQIISNVEGVSLIELAVQTSVNGMPAILRFIESILPIIERRDLKLVLYPHLLHVTQTTAQVVEICKRFNHPKLGVSFNGFHWYGSKEGNLMERLQDMKPWLMQVVLSGSEISPLGWGKIATMQPPDEGALDNFIILSALHHINYSGSIGILGWDYAGDVYTKLQRSLTTLRNMDQRIQKFPNINQLFEPQK